MKKIYNNFFKNNEYNDPKVYKIFFYLIVTFYLIGSTHWIESTEWGYVLSQKTNFSHFNLFYNEALKDFSLVSYLSSFLIKIGVSLKIINFCFYIIINLVSIIAVLNISKLFIKSNVYILLPLLLLFVNFDNSHGYDVVYPNNYWVFGQLGSYIFLLSIYFFIIKKFKLGLISLIILSLVHLVWFVGALVFISIKFYLEYFNKKQYLNYILIITITFLIILFLLKINCNNLNIDFCDYYTGYNYFNDYTLEGHNKKIFIENYNIYSVISFFKTELLLLLIFIILNKEGEVKLFVKTSLYFTFFIILLKIYETIDYRLYILDFFNLKDVYIRAIPERFFNLNTFVLYILIIGKLIEYLINKRSNIFLFILLLIIVYYGIFQEFNYEKSTTITQYLIISCLIIYLIDSNNFKTPLLFSSLNNKIKFVEANFINIFFTILFIISMKLIYFNKFYMNGYESDITSYLNSNKSDNQTIFLSSYINLDRFNPMLETSLEHVIPNSNIIINDNYFYCSNKESNWNNWYISINECLSNKTSLEWKKIAEDIGNFYLITNKDYKINLNLLIDGNLFRLYSYN